MFLCTFSDLPPLPPGVRFSGFLPVAWPEKVWPSLTDPGWPRSHSTLCLETAKGKELSPYSESGWDILASVDTEDQRNSMQIVPHGNRAGKRQIISILLNRSEQNIPGHLADSLLRPCWDGSTAWWVTSTWFRAFSFRFTKLDLLHPSPSSQEGLYLSRTAL